MHLQVENSFNTNIKSADLNVCVCWVNLERQKGEQQAREHTGNETQC